MHDCSYKSLDTMSRGRGGDRTDKLPSPSCRWCVVPAQLLTRVPLEPQEGLSLSLWWPSLPNSPCSHPSERYM